MIFHVFKILLKNLGYMMSYFNQEISNQGLKKVYIKDWYMEALHNYLQKEKSHGPSQAKRKIQKQLK